MVRSGRAAPAPIVRPGPSSSCSSSSALYALLRSQRDELVDFVVPRTAAFRFLAHEPLYRPDDGHYQYKYFPAFAQLMVPFTWVSKEVAQFTWFTLTVAMTWAFVSLSIAALPERRLSVRVLFWLTLLLNGKFLVKELAFGQFNLPVALLMLGAVMAAQHGRGLAAGALVAAGVFVKPYALVLVPWLALALGWRPLVPFGLVLAGGLLLPAASYGWNGNLTLLHEWYRTVTDTTGPNLLGHENISFASFWAKWIGPGTLAARLALASAVIAVAAGVAVMWRRRHVAEPNYLEAAYFFVLIPLAVASRLGLCAADRVARLHVPRRSVARLVAELARGGLDGVLPHELHHLRPAAAAALHSPHGVGRGQRWRGADCRLPHSLAVAGSRVSAGVSPETHVSDMTARLRPFALLAVIVLAVVVYNTRVRHEMVDFITWRQAVVRALDAEPLYRPEDGHYQFKYFPMFAVMMAPFGVVDQDTGKMLWFAIEVGLLAALLRWSITALPERRLSQRTLLLFAIVLMAKFYAHELLLGQTNLLLGVLLVAMLLAVQIDRRIIAGGLVGLAVFVKPYALILVPWLLVTQGWRSRRHGRRNRGHRSVAAGRRLWLERQPGPAARMAAHGD